MKKIAFNFTKKLCLLFVATSFSFNSIQGQSLQWNANMGSASKNAAANKVTADASGNVISVGFFGGTADFDPSAGVGSLTAGGSSINGFVQKLTTAGVYVWAKGFVGTGSCDVKGVATDASGNVYVTGNFNGSIDFDPGSAVVTLTTSAATDDDVFIVKLTSAGVFSWAKKIASTSDDIGNAITLDASGNVFIGGNIGTGSGTNLTIDMDPGAGVANVTANSTDGFVLKLDNNGNYLLSQVYGGNFDDALNDIETDATGNVYIVGSFYQSVSSLFATVANDYYGAYTAKLTNALVKIWSTRTNSPGSTTNTQAHGIGIEVDASGNVYYSGDYKLWTANTIDFDPGASTAYLTSASPALYNCFVSKLSSAGALTWVKNVIEASSSASTNGNSTLNDISLDGSNNILCTGTYTGSVDFDPTTGTYIKNSAGARDFYVTKLDPSGNFYDVQTYGSTGEDRAYGIKAVSTTAYYVAGLFTGTVDFSSSITTSTLTTVGTSDAFVAKYAPCNEPAVAVASTPSVITICAQTNTVLAVTAVGGVTFNWYNTAAGGTLLGSGSSFTTANITTTTSLWAEATNTCGAAARVKFTINTNPAPVITVSASSSTICAGGTTTLTASGASSYAWSGGLPSNATVTASPSSTTIYTVTGNNGTCNGTKTITVNVATPTVAVNNASVCSGASVTLAASGASTYSWATTGVTTATISVSPSANTTYTVIGTTAGCSNTKTVSVSVNASPTVAVNNASVCAGSSVTLTASGAASYSWLTTGVTTPTISVAPTSNTIYTVTGTASGCTNTKTVNVTVNSLPVVTLGSITSPQCVNNGSITLTGSPSGGVYTGPGVSGASFNPAVSGAGTFTVNYSYTAANTCSATASRTVTVSLCTGVDEIMTTGRSIHIYPNPSNGEFTILFPVKGTYSIINTIGQTVSIITVSDDYEKIKIEGYAQGVYYIVGKSSKAKVIVTK